MLLSLFWASLASAELLSLPFEKIIVDKPAGGRQIRDLTVPIENDVAHQRYLVNITVGTPPQQFALTVDTGSADLWFPIVNDSACTPSCPPTFNPKDSSTAVDLERIFNASYGLSAGLSVVGEYYNDTVLLGNATISNMTADVPPAIYNAGIFGLMGLGPRYQEAIYASPSSPYFRNSSATFPTLYDQLQLNGYIQRRLFSLWLNEQSSTTGTILFGGVDHTKYSGELLPVPVITSGPPSQPVFASWAINLTGTSYGNSNSGVSQNLTGNSTGDIVVLDSGSPNMYLPTAVADAVNELLGATSYEGFPYVNCSLRDNMAQSLTFSFDNNGTGPSINVPVPEIIYPFGDPANIGNVTAVDGTPLCYLGLIGTPGPIFLLGDTFIRSAYVVYDVDNLEVSMAQAVYNSDP